MRRIAISGALGVGLVAVALGIFLTRSSHANTTRYRIGEGTTVGADQASADAGPVRLARIADTHGQVSYRPSGSSNWTDAKLNVPLRQGSEVWVKPGSRADVQFDDGSDLRMGGGAVARLQNMYSDKRGEFTDVNLDSGVATLRTRSALSDYQIDTPYSSVDANGDSQVRVGVGDNNGPVEVDCQQGQAEVQGDEGQQVLDQNQVVDIPNDSTPYDVQPAPVQQDSWDQYNDQRDVVDESVDQHLPSDIGLVAGDLQDYGSWHDDPQYGQVWCPRVATTWSPYSEGEWVYTSPVGWTWCDSEPWGYAPSHYGTWVHEAYGWSWCPGPAVQAWSPAVVQFTDYNDQVAWCPLAPSEVQYPAVLDVGFSGGNWALNFSIGQVGCYYPVSDGYCGPSLWSNAYLNTCENVYNETNITNIYNTTNVYNNNTYGMNNRFISRNAFDPTGVTVANRTTFVNGGRFQRNTLGATVFRNGRSFMTAPIQQPVSGPFTTRPTLASFTPTRTFSRLTPPQKVVNRTVYRTALPVNIARTGIASRTVATVAQRTVGVSNRTVARGLSAEPILGPHSIRRVTTPQRTVAVANRATARGLTQQPVLGRNSAKPITVANGSRYNRFNTISKYVPNTTSVGRVSRVAAVTATGRVSRTVGTRSITSFARPRTGQVAMRSPGRQLPTRNYRSTSVASRVPTLPRTVAQRPRQVVRTNQPLTRALRQNLPARTQAFRPMTRTSQPARQPFTFSRPATTTRANTSFQRPAPRSNFGFSQPTRSTFNYSRPAPAPRANMSFSRPAPRTNYGSSRPQRSTFNYSRPAPAPRANMSFSRPAPRTNFGSSRPQRSTFNYSRPAPAPRTNTSFARPAPAPRTNNATPAPRQRKGGH